MENEKDWYEGVPVPVDADGNVVPLATRRLYDRDDREYEVKEISLADSGLRGGPAWRVKRSDDAVVLLEFLHLERPDSWERLEDDATMPPVSYCEARGIASLSWSHLVNTSAMCLDIVRRAKALAGVGGKGGEARGDEWRRRGREVGKA